MASPAPIWVSLAASAIRSLPIGRYQVANALARLSRQPFLARMPADLGGASFLCDLHDSIAREVCFTGRYEPQETQLAMRLLRPGMAVADVGANWGYFTLLSAHLVGATGRVVAFEPHPHLATILAGNADRNRLTQIEVVELAAGSGPGKRAFVGYDDGDGNSGVSRAAGASEDADFEAATVTLDAFFDERQCDRIDLLKMDIEGDEAEAIQGMRAGLTSGRYRNILLECHPAALASSGHSLEDCIEPFVRAGYRGWHIDHSRMMHRRAATSAVSVEELLKPIQPDAIGTDPWLHLLWSARDETPLA